MLNGMLFDKEWTLCGVLDWEKTFAAPVGLAARGPLGVESGSSVNMQDYDQEAYVAAVEEEEKCGFFEYLLSPALLDGMRLG